MPEASNSSGILVFASPLTLASSSEMVWVLHFSQLLSSIIILESCWYGGMTWGNEIILQYCN